MMRTTEEQWLRRRRSLQTEEEWRSCEFVSPIGQLIKHEQMGHRKPRLFTAACMRRLWHWPRLEQYHWAVEALERQADGLLTAEEAVAIASALREVRLASTEVMGGMYWQMSIDYSEEPETDPWRIAWGTTEAMLILAGRIVRVSAGLPDDRPTEEHWAEEERAQCSLRRCVFGNPFHTAAFDTKWGSPTVRTLAIAAYDERALPAGTLDLARLVVLGDALEEAGCTEHRLLDHLRGAELHVRGCWGVDLVLGRG
jgi:hypothetical protein